MSNLHAVKKLWTRIVQTDPEVSSLSERWWTIVESRYSEKQRRYHTLQHLEDMCTHLEGCKHKLADYNSVFYAVIFHDLVYEPTRCDNEERSAELFLEFAAQYHLPVDVASKIREWILLTKIHKTAAHTTPGLYGMDDSHYFLDLDMAVLGRKQSDYATYTKEIREEYSHIPSEIFRVKRSRVLKSFLQTPNIFATKEFRDRFERQARENIQEEIYQLES